jgi:hypothetical protein
MHNNIFPKTAFFTRYVEKYDRARQATDDNIIGRMLVSFWVTKATTQPQNM